jgi:hypothetical protein
VLGFALAYTLNIHIIMILNDFCLFPAYFCHVIINGLMLGGSLVTTAWRVLRLQIQGSPPGTEGSSRGQPTRGGPPA